MRYILVALLSLGFLGCSPHKKYDRTPAGWNVHWKDQGTIATGLHTKQELYNLFDAAMVRGLTESDRDMNFPPGTSLARARDYDTLYTLVDNAWFPASGGGYAAGEIIGRHNMTVAFYSLTYVPNGGVITGPPWTIHAGIDHPQNTYFGIEVDGEQYPAMGHELREMNGYPID